MEGFVPVKNEASSSDQQNPPIDVYIYVYISLTGKDHVCRFVGCGRNDRFNYVVMELQVGFSPVTANQAFDMHWAPFRSAL